MQSPAQNVFLHSKRIAGIVRDQIYGNQVELCKTLPSILSVTQPVGSGPRYQILSHVFARCASQTTHGHARIARVRTCENRTRFACDSRMKKETRAILACPCVVWLAQRAKVSFACDSHISVCCLTRSTCKKVWHRSYTSGHCLCHCDSLCQGLKLMSIPNSTKTTWLPSCDGSSVAVLKTLSGRTWIGGELQLIRAAPSLQELSVE